MPELVNITSLDDGALWRVTFGVSKGNVLDRAMLRALADTFVTARHTPTLKAICLEGAGDHFSFGASVQEHLPGEVGQMLDDLRRLVFAMFDSHVFVVAAVRGQCLGGGLEVASLCHRIVATTGAKLGQPEILLGVFAPLASLVLPHRVGLMRAEDLCLTGRVIPATEAQEMGLVSEVTDEDPADVAIAWLRKHLLPLSASSLRLGVKAIRADLATRLREQLPAVEALYLDELMATSDASEGLRAFLEKRKPIWRHA